MSLLVGAIDLSEDSAGWAFSFRHEFEKDAMKINLKYWCDTMLVTTTTPLCVLIKPDGKTLDAFGYDAERKYAELIEEEMHTQFFYFNNITLGLINKYRQGEKQIFLEDVMGKPLPALTVLSLAIKYLKNDMVEYIQKRTSSFDDVMNDMYTVLTVPTSFKDTEAMHSISEAACKAGIDVNLFTIVTDMDAASIYYHHLSSKKTSDGKSRYMLVKAGVTTNTVVHEAERYGEIKEVSQVNTSAYGSKMVDKAIENFMEEIFGRTVYDKFKSTKPDDYLDFTRGIEMRKREFSLYREQKVTLRTQPSLEDLYMEFSQKRLKEGIKHSVYSSDVTILCNKMRLSPNIGRSFFEEATQKVISVVQGALEKDNVEVLRMFGQFADLPVLQDAVKIAFPKIDVVIEPNVSLKGAVIAGHSHISVKKLKQAQKPIMVAAIDFGTTYSGWALSFDAYFQSDRTKASVRKWHSGSTETEKTPTCILIRPDGQTIEAFGYEAENRYRDLIDSGEHEKYYYFRRFKMMLNKKLGEKINREVTLEDEMGRSLPAIDVFSMSIRFLKDDVLTGGNKQLKGNLEKQDIHWVLTVPAIWTDGAKQFMREASIKAGIESKRLTIALEPEAASIYCRHLPVDKAVGGTGVSVSSFKAGTRYMVLDAGGGTIDITVHEVDTNDGVKEVHAACGGGCGGTMVDKEFEKLLIGLLGTRVYQRFKRENIEDWLELWRDFEVKKRDISPLQTSPVRMKLPLSLIEMFAEDSKCSLKEAIGKSKYSKDVDFSGDKIKFSPTISKSFFKSSVDGTISLVRSVLQDIPVTAILMVGGYSDSKMLHQAVKSTFNSLEVVVPYEASYCILKGALIFGHMPKFITKRVLKYTYGIEVLGEFVEGKHPESKRVQTDKGDRCKNIFDKHVEKNQSVNVGEPQVHKKYFPAYKDQKTIGLSVYAAEILNPTYTDQSCTFAGKLAVVLAEEGGMDREVLVALTFSDTEIVVEATEKGTGKETYAAIDFLG